MVRKKSYFSGVPRTNKKDPTQDAIAENIEVLTGQRGDKANRALLYRDLVDLDDMKRRALINSINQTGAGGLPIVTGGGIEPPHAPVNLEGVGGFTFIALTWDHPTYKGHAYAEIFRSETDVFSEAVRIATEVTDIFSDTVNMGSSYYYWVRFVNKADMVGPTQGANGLHVETQQSAEQILGEIGGLIEKSHLGTFLTTEVDKIPVLSVDVEDLKVDMPSVKAALFDEGGPVDLAKKEADEAKATSEAVLATNESMALNLIDAALLSDKNWQNNTTNLVSIEESINGVKAVIESNFYTMAEADEAIAAAATTIQVMIEENGTSLSGNISETYYTKASTDEAIALADLALKSAIEDVNGSSLGATLNNDYYTKVDADSAISVAGDTLKAEIEDVNGDSLGATLFTNYYTSVDTDNAIAQADLALKAVIENVNGSSLGATLYNGYYTKTDTDSAISSASTSLKSEIENTEGDSVGATLFNFYETKADRESSTAKSIFELSSEYNANAQANIENALANDIESDRQRVIAANFIETQKTFADESEALSESLTLLEAQVDDSKSSVLKLTQSIATNISATAQELLLLGAKIGGVSADIYQNFYTRADADIATAQADLALKAALEESITNADNVLMDSVIAELQTNYETSTSINEAISNATTALKSTIDTEYADADQALQNTINSDLQANYYTKTTADEAIASATLALKSTIDTEYADADTAILSTGNSDLQTNYYTSTTTDTAIANATTQLKADIENSSGNSLGADLYNNYYTSVDADSAIAEANTILRAEIEDANGSSVGASLQTLSETVANNTGDFSAMWGVKTQVADITASFGLLNDGDDPIFAIKGAKFAIITDQDPTVVTPVFAVVDGKTVIKSALIDEAHIQSLVTDDLLSNRIVVGSELNTPSINYNKTTGARSQNFSMDPSGNIVAKSAVLESVTIKDAQGNVVMSSTGAVPYSKLTGTPTLGALASADSVDYDSLTGKPNLGSLAALNNLAYASLIDKPTLGALAALNSLGYDALTGKPTLGALAALNSISYDSVTGKPTLGPFAGLTKILSTNITTYIESGAIGSAQIDQAYIDELFGNNASFLGTVYAENIQGDVTDAITKRYTGVYNGNQATTFTLLSGSVAPASFDRAILFGSIQLSSLLDSVSEEDAVIGITLKYKVGGVIMGTLYDKASVYNTSATVKLNYGSFCSIVPSSSSATSFAIEAYISSEYGYSKPETSQPNPCVVSVFKTGGSLS